MDRDNVLEETDIQQLTRLVIEFSWRGDHQKANTLAELVTDDMEMLMPGKPIIGKPAFIEWGNKRAKATYVTRHIVNNMRFESAGPNRATGTSSCLAFVLEREGEPPRSPFVLREFIDTFAKHEGVWKFSSRTSHNLGPGHPPVLV